MLRSSKTAAAALGLGLLLLAGCNTNVEELLDPQSRERLAAIPEGTDVIVSLTGDTAPDPLPPLGGGRALGRSGNSVLLEVPRDVLPTLGGIDGLRSGTVWGPADMLGRMDPGLRSALLEAFDQGREAEPMPMIARFSDAAADPRGAVEGLGATVGSEAAGIVTLQATPLTALTLLTLPDLVQLTKPKLLHPTPGRTVGDESDG